PGVSTEARRRMLDSLGRLNQKEYDEVADPETQARIAQYEMAFRMQTSMPELMDLSREPKHIMEMYGPERHQSGQFRSHLRLASALLHHLDGRRRYQARHALR